LRVTRRTSRTTGAGKRRDASLPGCSHKGDATLTETKNLADDLVTDEMVEIAHEVMVADHGDFRDDLAAALRAVAPMIAARATTDAGVRLTMASSVRLAERREREACAKIAENRAEEGECGTWQAQEGLIIAAAIRARGETP
jgi:hypothetical protein